MSRLLLAALLVLVVVALVFARPGRSSTASRALYAIHLASAAYGVSEQDMRTVARCETADFSDFYNESSGASGLFQWLPSTWARSGLRGFSVWNMIANALATARLVAREGWVEWSCRP